jgi:hypothetical protein
MAEGVERAACVVCFLTEQYQRSANCALEVKFARQSGVPIVPGARHPTTSARPPARPPGASPAARSDALTPSLPS